ncbi:hypothetical protein AAF712_007648 [Marasmius tenuissimus]|uniref:GmrSD restriction endonucleases N-terminal domain-containing protein n=1 Tax=Marasmius tenuissimus TaxID=585030 RepID=A0ABR2ZVY0_9AGAR
MDSDSQLSDLEENIQLSSPHVPSTARESQRKKTSTAKKPGKVAETFKLTNTLKVPRATTYAASALNEQVIRGDIELNPEYQRDVVWTTQKQIGLIDSIFRNFYVPPVIFSVTCNEDGSETKICIDGKQRLTSIHLFMTGAIPHRDAETGQQYWFVKDPKDKKELLPEKYRMIFSNKQIVCVEYQELKDTDERDIFTRVQLGVALTPAEKLQAISTPRVDLIRRLMERFVTPETLAHPDVVWDRTRARDFQIVGSVLYYLFKWDKHSGAKAWISTSNLETWLSESVSGRKTKKDSKSRREGDGEPDQKKGIPVDQEFEESVIKTFEIVVKIATKRRYSAPFRASKSIGPKVSPVEMVGVFVLVYAVHISPPKTSKKEVTLAGLAALFVLLRKRIREEHTDVRSNGRVGRTMFDFCLDAAKDPVDMLTEGEDAGLLEGEVEENAKWMQVKPPARVVAKNPKPVESEEDGSSDGEGVVRSSKGEEEEKTVPAKRRRTTGRLSAPHGMAKSSLLSKRRKSEPGSRRPKSECASDDEPRSIPARKSVMSHVSLPVATSSRNLRRSERLSPVADAEGCSESHSDTVNTQSSTLTPLSPETSPQFAVPSPLPSGSPSLIDSYQSNENETPDLPQGSAGSSVPTVISPSLPVPTAEQLLTVMGVSVAPEMIPLMVAQMKLLAQGGAQMLPQVPFLPSSQTTISTSYVEAGQNAEVKDEVGGASDPVQENLFAVNLARGIQGGTFQTDD